MSRRSRTCDCGAPKTPGDEACPRCRTLDGDSVASADVIAALRYLGGRATLAALVITTGKAERRVRYALVELQESGRLERRVEELPPDFTRRDRLHMGHAEPLWILRGGDGDRAAYEQVCFGVPGFAAICRCKTWHDVLSLSGQVIGRLCCRCGTVAGPSVLRLTAQVKSWKQVDWILAWERRARRGPFRRQAA
jgi:hypothetical protein